MLSFIISSLFVLTKSRMPTGCTEKPFTLQSIYDLDIDVSIDLIEYEYNGNTYKTGKIQLLFDTSLQTGTYLYEIFYNSRDGSKLKVIRGYYKMDSILGGGYDYITSSDSMGYFSGIDITGDKLEFNLKYKNKFINEDMSGTFYIEMLNGDSGYCSKPLYLHNGDKILRSYRDMADDNEDCWNQTISVVINTAAPTNAPTNSPTPTPTNSPTNNPTASPTLAPTLPTNAPTNSPTLSPTNNPTNAPTNSPTLSPTNSPTLSPTNKPTNSPTLSPTNNPTNNPTNAPTLKPTDNSRNIIPLPEEPEETQKNNEVVYIISGIVILVTLIIIIIISCLCCKCCKKQEIKNHDELDLEEQSVSRNEGESKINMTYQ